MLGEHAFILSQRQRLDLLECLNALLPMPAP
jgi:hypothetical protein